MLYSHVFMLYSHVFMLYSHVFMLYSTCIYVYNMYRSNELPQKRDAQDKLSDK